MADSLFVPTEVTADLAALEKLLKRIAIEWEMFINRSVQWPPHQRQAEIEAIIRHYTKAPPRRTAERFRFNTLVHRYRTNSERWSRRLRRVEESGNGRGSASHRIGREERAAGEDVSRIQTLHRIRARAGRAKGDQMRDLYRAFREARKARGKSVSRLAYRDFAQRVDVYLQQARQRAAGQDVELRVDEVGGKVRIALRPATGDGPSTSRGGR